MKIGSYEVPDFRLVPNALEILEDIYKVKHRDRVPSKEIALLLGYKYGTEPHFYRRLKSLTEYGLLEGKGNYQVSDLGESVLHPKNESEKNLARTKAVMNVRLWNEIYKKHGKNPRQDNFWAILMDVAKISPDKAKQVQSKIFKWYSEDMAHVSDDLVGVENIDRPKEEEPKGLSSKDGNNKSMSQALEGVPAESFGRFILPNVGYVDVTDEDTLQIAKSYLNVLEKKIKASKDRKPPEQPQE